jgi:hypothetical protein
MPRSRVPRARPTPLPSASRAGNRHDPLSLPPPRSLPNGAIDGLLPSLSPRRPLLSLSLSLSLYKRPSFSLSLPPQAFSLSFTPKAHPRSPSTGAAPRLAGAVPHTPIEPLPCSPARPSLPCSPNPPCTRTRAQGRRKLFCVLALRISQNYFCIFCITNVCKSDSKTLCATLQFICVVVNKPHNEINLLGSDLGTIGRGVRCHYQSWDNNCGYMG